ncbi:MAG: asparagine synthase (glutamine-hydrolyzing) [Thermodesulfobacteriota bacterium]|nr:asparagine synthase (glutamine-hydrolyzing) [Thermodesulfobacteriota bacterium]
MCGICGKLNYDAAWPVEEGLIRRMCSVLVHRGPDDEGVYTDGPIGLGHRRLSIIDLSPAGHQPMSNVDGTVWIVFNGEIYNFLDLRGDLEKKGYRFRSRSDTEVLLHLYEAEGVDCLQRLRGMFAFAIWDARKQLLFLARDRLGKKPVFYRAGPTCLIFASEIKAILEDPEVKREVDPVAIHHYLTYQYVPSPFCAFKGLSKLPPAHYLLCQDGKVEVNRYWKLSYLPKYPVTTDRQRRQLEEELLVRFEEAVRLRLISDVPLGAFLSGGVDSSAVVAMMSRLMNQPVKTFSIGFDEASYNELPYARIVANRFKTDHTEFKVKPDAVEVLSKLVWYYNEPYADSSAIPTYYVSKLAREHVTVALNGDAGDENFAGYGRYAANEFARRYDKILRTFNPRWVQSIISKLPSGQNQNNFIWVLKRFSEELNKSPEIRNLGWLCHFDNEKKGQLYTEDFKARMNGIDSNELLLEKYQEAEADDFIDSTLYSDVMMYLPDDLLVKVDITSMANSLEARSPFLDHVFMEFVAKIPAELKLRGKKTKWILKQTLRNILPPEILDRKKMGFGVPIDHWLRNELKPMAYDLLLGQRSLERGYFKKDFIQKMLDEHCSAKWNWHYHIWNLLMLELWHRMFIDVP